MDPCTKDLSLDEWAAQIEPALMDIQRFQGNRSQHWDMALRAATIGIAQNEQIRAQEHPAVCTRQIKTRFTVMQDVSNKDGLTDWLGNGNWTAYKKACLA